MKQENKTYYFIENIITTTIAIIFYILLFTSVPRIIYIYYSNDVSFYKAINEHIYEIKHFFYSEIDEENIIFRKDTAYIVNSSKPFTGVSVSKYSNGQIKNYFTYKNGLLNGKYLSYYNNGQIMIETYYVNGIIENKQIEYYNNGQIMHDYYYKDNQATCGTTYNYNGEITEYFPCKTTIIRDKRINK